MRWIFYFVFGSLAAEISSFTLITIPKAGSHMLMKALYFMTGTSAIWHTHYPSFWLIPPENGFLYTHFCLTPELEADYAALPDLKKIIAIRDLRDVAVSITHHIQKGLWPGMGGEQREAFLELPFNEQLLFVINFEYDVHEVAEYAPNSNQASLTKVAEQAIQYANDPNHLVCRYEDIVGPHGGGSLGAQLDTLRRMARFLNIDISEGELLIIAFKLYGNEFNPFGTGGFRNFGSTFHTGKIGSWVEVFTEEHKAAFKKKLGPSLIQLGYAQDDLW